MLLSPKQILKKAPLSKSPKKGKPWTISKDSMGFTFTSQTNRQELKGKLPTRAVSRRQTPVGSAEVAKRLGEALVWRTVWPGGRGWGRTSDCRKGAPGGLSKAQCSVVELRSAGRKGRGAGVGALPEPGPRAPRGRTQSLGPETELDA